MELDRIYKMDCLDGLKMMGDKSVQCCITSPPYWCQRNYEVDGQYGWEETPELYIEKLVEVFEEVRRILKNDGVLWLNLGDCYWGSGKAGKNEEYQKRHIAFKKLITEKSRFGKPTTGKHHELKNKDLVGLPWMLAFALRKKGWWLRQEVIWDKRNAAPESARDRCTRNHEHIFMFTKSSKYFYDADAIKVKIKRSTIERMGRSISDKNKYANGLNGKAAQKLNLKRGSINNISADSKVNRRSVWSFSNNGTREKHFATFPMSIPELCIKAGSKIDDVILDPFIGSGTTAIVASLLDRHFIGFELNPKYVAIANRRLKKLLGLFWQID